MTADGGGSAGGAGGEGAAPAADGARARRLAEITATLVAWNRPLVPTMSEEHFQAMIRCMAEHQLLYEEFSAGQR